MSGRKRNHYESENSYSQTQTYTQSGTEYSRTEDYSESEATDITVTAREKSVLNDSSSSASTIINTMNPKSMAQSQALTTVTAISRKSNDDRLEPDTILAGPSKADGTLRSR